MKYAPARTALIRNNVLPLTREWIEISIKPLLFNALSVLPLTREWIEIANLIKLAEVVSFSLLRGSGLK